MEVVAIRGGRLAELCMRAQLIRDPAETALRGSAVQHYLRTVSNEELPPSFVLERALSDMRNLHNTPRSL